jgi:hypothetical protein
MDVNKILGALRQERSRIEEVIISLELLALSRQRRRGRPPAILAAANRKRGRPRGSKNKTSRPKVVPKVAMVAAAQQAERALAAGQSVSSGSGMVS